MKLDIPFLIKAAIVTFVAATVPQIIWLFYSWIGGIGFGLGYWIWVVLLVVLYLVVAALVVIFRKRIWPHDPAAGEARKLGQLAQRQFTQARARARVIHADNDNVPWYLFIASHKAETSTVMAELGYVAFGDPVEHEGLVLGTWASPTAIAYRIEVQDTDVPSFDIIDLLFTKLARNRPSLAINAAYVEVELAEIIEATAVHTGRISTINRILNAAALEFGLNFPVHMALVGLDKMLDLSRAALLTGQLGEGVILGGFLPEGEGTAGERADMLFDGLIRNFNQGQFPALQRQLLPEFCAALLNAPLQLELIKSQLRPRISTLLQPLPPRSVPLDLQSIVFIGARDGMPEVDPLSQVTGQKFFSGAPASSLTDTVQTSVTTENAGLLALAYHNESFLLAPNRRKSATRRAYAGFWTVLLAGIVGTFGYFTWENYNAYNSLNDRMEQAFVQYFGAVGGITTDSDFLVQRTLMLQPLREGLEDYKALNNQTFRAFLPKASLEEMYRGFYDQELVDGFQASLVSFLEKEIFAFNSLSDGTELVQLATIEAQLHTDQIDYKDDLVSYYTLGLADQGEVSGAFQSAFKAILEDLFTLNRPRENRNENLQAVVTKTLTGLDTADLLYQSLIGKPEYAERVDLRSRIGPRFFEIFVPLEDPDIFLVPRVFTREGFEQFFEAGDIPDLAVALDGYEAAIGPIDAAQKNAIGRRVAQNYTGAYIRHWSNFLKSLRLRDAADWSDARILMTALTQSAENPIDQLVDTIAVNTDIKIFLPEAPAAAPAAGGAGDGAKPKAEAAPERKLAPPTASAEAAAAFNIRSAFRSYLDAMQQGADGESTFDLFLTYSRAVNAWLREVSEAENGIGAYLFGQFQNPEVPKPLATLNAHAQRTDIDIIRSFGSSIASSLDNHAMEFVRDYIDEQWKARILDPYGGQIRQTFPFAAFSDLDFPLAEFTDMFGPEGRFRVFEKTFLAAFRGQDNSFIPRSTFIRNGRVELADQARETLVRFGQISESMFVDGKPFVKFGLRTGFLASGLGRLTVTSGVTLHQYSHGPIRWSSQTWPLAGVQNENISLRIFRRSRAVFNETYRGPWSWFRLAQGGSGSINPALGTAESAFPTEHGEAILEFDADARHTPFAPGFFSEVYLPRSLFKPETVSGDGEEAEGKALLFAWRNDVPAANRILIDDNAETLSPVVRRSIQQYLRKEGFYEEDVDGIFGPATRDALLAWRESPLQADQ